MTQLLDWRGFLDRLDGDVALAAELAGLFLGRAPDLVASLRTAVRAGDPKAIRFAAHTLRGTVSVFGIPAAEALAQTLEDLGAAGQCAGAEPATLELAGMIAEVEREVRAWLAGSVASGQGA